MLDLFSRYAEKISPQKIALWRDNRLKKVTDATVNRDLNLISSVITMAIKEWGLDVPSNPVRMIKRPPVVTARDRRISKDKKNKIANSLK